MALGTVGTVIVAVGHGVSTWAAGVGLGVVVGAGAEGGMVRVERGPRDGTKGGIVIVGSNAVSGMVGAVVVSSNATGTIVGFTEG